MKLITFAVPSYNSEAFMHTCIDSLLTLGDECEIIIVNDGSKDGTAEVADRYASQYPNIVIAHHKENGGHGSGVNAGLAMAKGLYYKVVDSDDWVNAEELAGLVAVMKEHIASNQSPDLYITNYVYEKVCDNEQFVRGYTKLLPQDKFFSWDEVGNFKYSEMLMMHSLWYKTDTLRKSGVELPKHTFYVDDIFCYTPMPHISSMYYLNRDVYRYLIGREGQSVNLTQAGKNYKMMIRVMKELVAAHNITDYKKSNPKLYRYMLHCLTAFTMVTLTFASANASKEAKQDIKQMWRDIKGMNKWLYGKLKYRTYNALFCNLPWFMSRRIIIMGYKILRRKVKLG